MTAMSVISGSFKFKFVAGAKRVTPLVFPSVSESELEHLCACTQIRCQFTSPPRRLIDVSYLSIGVSGCDNLNASRLQLQ